MSLVGIYGMVIWIINDSKNNYKSGTHHRQRRHGVKSAGPEGAPRSGVTSHSVWLEPKVLG